jgi:hypothetical protein
VQEINRIAVSKDTELPFFWAFVDAADPTSVIVKVPMHCFYGDRGSLSSSRIESGGHFSNARHVLDSMDRVGAMGFEYHIRFRPHPPSSTPQAGRPKIADPPVIRLMRPALVPKTGNVMHTGAHCTDLLQPERWSDRLSVNLVLPWLIANLTDPQSGHSVASVASLTSQAYCEEQVYSCFIACRHHRS